MHPILPEQEGNNRFDLKDKNGVMIIQEIMKVATGTNKGGFNEFYFTKSDGVTVAPKIVYSEMFEPWGWIVSTGNYVDDINTNKDTVKIEVARRYNRMINLIVIVEFVIMIAATVAVGVLEILSVNHYTRFRILQIVCQPET